MLVVAELAEHRGRYAEARQAEHGVAGRTARNQPRFNRQPVEHRPLELRIDHDHPAFFSGDGAEKRIVHLNENVQKRRTDAEQLKCASLFGVAPVQNTHLITSDIPPPRL